MPSAIALGTICGHGGGSGGSGSGSSMVSE